MRKRRISIGLIYMMLLCTMMLACGNEERDCKEHVWTEATCQRPKTCLVCGVVEGEEAEHVWGEATCQRPRTCLSCGDIEGEALEHMWIEATCQMPRICSICSEKEGEVAEHMWVEASCRLPKTCSVCGESDGDVLEHVWKSANCQTPKTCSVCGESDGDVGSHKLDSEKICLTCGKKGIQLTKSNYKQYLNIWFDCYIEDGTSFIEIKISPKTENLTFLNAKVWWTATALQPSGASDTLRLETNINAHGYPGGILRNRVGLDEKVKVEFDEIVKLFGYVFR